MPLPASWRRCEPEWTRPSDSLPRLDLCRYKLGGCHASAPQH